MIDIHAHALEAFNRATHSEALPEMQIAPAEELQADSLPLAGATIPFWMLPATAFFASILTIIGAHTL